MKIPRSICSGKLGDLRSGLVIDNLKCPFVLTDVSGTRCIWVHRRIDSWQRRSTMGLMESC